MAFQYIYRKKPVPVFLKLLHGLINLPGGHKALLHGPGLFFVDHVVGFPFLFIGVLHIAQYEYDGLLLPGFKGEVEIVGCHGLPAMGDGIGGLAFKDSLGTVKTVIQADEGFAIGVIPIDRCVSPEEGIMVPALTVFCLMVDRRAFHLHFSG